MSRNLDYVEKRVLELERELTLIHLRGTDMIPENSALTFVRIDDIRKEIEDLTDGENTVRFNHRGQASPMYRFVADENAWDAAWADRLEEVPTSKTGTKHPLPCFQRNGALRRSFLVDKYSMVATYTGATAHVNRCIGLYDMPPAHSSGGFSVSYNGVVDEVEDLNAATLPTAFPSSLMDYVTDRHMITWDEYGFICLMYTRFGWQPSGNSLYGADPEGRLGDPAGYFYGNDYHPHTLTGSGPRQWRHNGRFTGIADLVGNVRTIASGLKVKDGIIQMIDFASNPETIAAANLKDSGTLWKAISTADGSFIDPATIGTVVDEQTVKAYCIDMNQEMSANSGSHTISDEILIRDNGFYDSVHNDDVEFKEGLRKDWRIQLAGYAPFKDFKLNGQQYMRNAIGSAFVALFGGYWGNGTAAGPRSLVGYDGFSGAGTYIGSRLASPDN